MTTDLNLRERPDRIGSRDYFRKGTPIERWKFRLTIAALILTGGWLLAGLFKPGYGVDRFSHGELAHAHATWDVQCEACHEPFRPVNQNTWFHDWYDPADRSDHWR